MADSQGGALRDSFDQFPDAVEISRSFVANEQSAEDIVETHASRIECHDAVINSLPVRLLDSAREAARRLDRQRITGQSVGELAAVPSSVKDCFAVKDTVSAIGLTGEFPTSESDAWCVSALRDAGACIVGKGNVPQLMLLYESDNPRHGRTSNPWNADRVAGGSSGGDAAAVAAGFSAIGLGTDLGGSIRVPAAFCGVCGFKPTSELLSRNGAARNFRGMEAFRFQPGPIARSVRDMRLVMDILCRAQAVDPRVPPVAGDIASAPVAGKRVAVLAEDTLFPRHPAVHRALSIASGYLSQAGVHVEEVAMPLYDEALELYVRLLAADGGRDVRRLAKNSRLDPHIRRMFTVGRIPRWLRAPLARVLENMGRGDEAWFLRTSVSASAASYWGLVDRLGVLRDRFQRFMTEGRWDAYLSPVFRTPAFRHGQCLDLIPAAVDAFFANLVEAPAGTVPVTFVGAEEMTDTEKQDAQRQRIIERVDTEACGLPVGVQVVAPVWKDCHVLDLLECIETARNGDVQTR